MLLLLLLFVAVAVAQAQVYQVPTALVEPLQPSGIRISIPDSDGLQLFAVHANLNKPIKELESGELSKDILSPENGRWVYQNDRIRLKPGDTLNYWLYVQKNKMGYRRDNISWTYLGNESPSRPQGPQGPGGSFRPGFPIQPPGVSGFEVPIFTTPEPFSTFPTLPTVTVAQPFRPPLTPLPLPPLPPPDSAGSGVIGGGGDAGPGSGFGGGGGGAGGDNDVRREEELHMLNLQLLRQILALRREEVDAEQRRLQELHQLKIRHLEELHQEELRLLRQSGQQRPVWRFRR